jgi:methionyl-tRNA synthetase
MAGLSQCAPMTRYLVTPALPYANGAAHLGHLVEHIQVNIFVRALRMAGEDVLYVCGADSHGTPIELKAKEAGVSPVEFAAQWQKAHEESFRRFGVEFDGGYGTTHTPENEAHAGRIFKALKEAGHIDRRDVEQLYDPEAGRFLADRMVKGTCPSCDAEDQYGDSCEVCSTHYKATELKDPKSAITGAVPELKKSEHLFVKLGAYGDKLHQWTSQPHVVNEDIHNYLNTWMEDGLKDWDISRDAPYHGFPIPDEEGKYFYVWLDAPIGYMSISERVAKSMGRSFDDYWNDPDTRIYHFIGKDIVYFHTLFWPAMLMAAGHTLPTKVAVHGMLTVDGVKMSKSRGTFILADHFAEHLGDVGVQALRYYFACKLNHRTEDIDLSLEDFTARVNADLVNKVVNLVSRTVPMLHRNHEGKAGSLDPDAADMLDEASHLALGVEGHYRNLDFSRVVRDVVAIADLGNRYLQDGKPWDTVKSDADKAHRQLTTALTLGKACVGLLKPILPDVAERLESMLGMEAPGFTFKNVMDTLPKGQAIAKYERLFERLDLKKVKGLVEPEGDAKAAEDGGKKGKAKKAKKPKAKFPPDPPAEIDIDTFFQVELRAAKVVEADHVDGADKLIRVKLDVGDKGERQVFAGLKPHVSPADLQGKMVTLVANLAPREMKFGKSEGMILAAGDDVPRPVFCDGASPGDRIR